MTKGGARSRSGPPPDPNALRRSRASDPAWTKIPASGRGNVPAPEWPDAVPDPSSRELAVWESWWANPIALLWEEARSTHYVAFAVRVFAESVMPKGRTEDRKAAKDLMRDLMLSHDSQLRARILIVDEDEPASLAAESDATVTSIKDRVRAANG